MTSVLMPSAPLVSGQLREGVYAPEHLVERVSGDFDDEFGALRVVTLAVPPACLDHAAHILAENDTPASSPSALGSHGRPRSVVNSTSSGLRSGSGTWLATSSLRTFAANFGTRTHRFCRSALGESWRNRPRDLVRTIVPPTQTSASIVRLPSGCSTASNRTSWNRIAIGSAVRSDVPSVNKM